LKKSIHLSVLAGVMVVVAAFGLTGAAGADIIAWNEAGPPPFHEFSHDRTMPTPVTLVAGHNDILGTDGRPSASTDPLNPDYFTFTVPTGFALAAITVLPNTTSAGPLNDSFIAIESPLITLAPIPNPPNAVGLLGWFHFGPEDIDTDILPEMGLTDPAHMGSTGFTPPLGAGTYSIWVQETGVCGPDLCHYGLDFVLAPIPEPASSAGLLTGIAVLAAVRRYRRQSPRRV